MSILYSDKKPAQLTLAMLLGCSAFFVPAPLHAEIIPAKTSWAVSRVASASQGSYCTMAQKYANETVLTLAHNTQNEYSLALDFKDQKFKEGQKQSITLSLPGETSKTYNIVPQSDKTAVINIGNDSNFIKKLSQTQNLKIGISNQSSEYGLTQFESGQDEMNTCMQALKNSSTQPKTAKDLPKQVEDIKPSAGEPTVEGLLSAMPMPSSNMEAAEIVVPEAPVVQNIKPKPAVVDHTKSANKEAVELTDLREENARLSRVIAEQRQSFEDKQAALNGAALDEIRQKFESTKVENESLRAELAKANSRTDVTKLNQDMLALNQSIKNLQDENQSLKVKLAEQRTLAEKPSRDLQVKSEPVSASDQQELAKLKTENLNLQQQIAHLKTTKEQASVTQADSEEVIKVRGEIRQLTAQVESLKVENTTLKNQAAAFQKDLEGKQMKMAGGSWDLEQATRRYQESQREIVRLGALLQAKDVQCANEKKDIEYMLFDPAIADKAQIAMLQSLEDQIKEKDQKLSLAEKEIQDARVKVSSEKDAQIAELQKNLAQTKTEFAEKSQKLIDAEAKAQQAEVAQLSLTSKDQLLASLKADMDVKAQKLAEAEAKIKQVASMQADLVQKEASLTAAKSELAQKSQQLIEAQNKIEQAQQSQQLLSSSTTQQDGVISALKAQLIQVQSQLAAEQAKSQLIEVKMQSQQSAEQASALAALQLQIQQGNQKIATLENAISANKALNLQATQAVASLTPAAAASPSPSILKPTVQPTTFKSIEEFSALLKNAGVPVRGSLQHIQGGDANTYRAYSWKTDSLYGSVEMKQVQNEMDFDTVIGQYLTRAKSRCSGEFAAVPSPVTAPNMMKSKSYEIACVGQSLSSSASVLFTYGHQIVTTIAHEGRAEAMDFAIDARDKVSTKLN